ncbi:hypothetical protein GCM10029976_047790 [Kribbella albertanoniae]|uniref:Pycsar system effector family protein n=1 Tax=Kribbella albertanoniae TaxID=1266829 RepID=UPI001404D3F1|nr:Pycsar system effector family protein [Kribbella albertanoniae]
MANDATETAWRLHGLLIDWIAKADGKAGQALLVQSAVLGALGIFGSPTATRSGPSSILVPVGAALLVTAAACSALAIAPILRSKKAARTGDEIAYFGHLRSRTREQLERDLLESDLLPMLSGQLIVLSDIAWSKFRWVRRSLLLGIAGAVVLVAAAVVG